MPYFFVNKKLKILANYYAIVRNHINLNQTGDRQIFFSVFRKTMSRSLFVVAIDIGTTFSSCAFSGLYEYNKDPLKVSGIRWKPGYDNIKDTRTQTSILFDSEENLDSFGYEAEKRYFELTEDENQHDWHYFPRFKQTLLLNEVNILYYI